MTHELLELLVMVGVPLKYNLAARGSCCNFLDANSWWLLTCRARFHAAVGMRGWGLGADTLWAQSTVTESGMQRVKLRFKSFA